jgi:hypothetical protein
MSTLRERAAKVLGWPMIDVESMSAAALVQLLALVDSKESAAVRAELQAEVRSGTHMVRQITLTTDRYPSDVDTTHDVTIEIPKKRKKETHAFGHARCQACEEGKPDGDPGHDRDADVCSRRP